MNENAHILYMILKNRQKYSLPFMLLMHCALLGRADSQWEQHEKNSVFMLFIDDRAC